MRVASSVGGDAAAASRLRERIGAVKASWDRGAAPDAREALGHDPGLRDDRVAVLELAYEEYLRRYEAGEAVDAEAFCDRFPECRGSLYRLVRMHHELSRLVGQLPPPAPSRWPQAGEQVGDFTLLRELGRGAFARVFLATEASAGDRSVVVKLSQHGDAEGRTLGRLAHPNVVPILSCRRDPETGLVVVCMPYLGGATLEEVYDRLFAPGADRPRRADRLLEAARATARPGDPPVESGAAQPRPPRGSYSNGVLRLGAQLAEALAFLHERGVCHRDLKPSNVLLDGDGCPRLLDFNLAADLAAQRSWLGGTLPYAAPEHIRALVGPAGGPQPDGAADIYSLGVLLYELLTGSHPFGPVPLDLSPEELGARMRQRQRAGCAPLRVPGLDRGAARLIERCLAPDPAARPASAAELAAGLRGASRRGGRWRWLVAATFAVLVAGAGWLRLADPGAGDYALGRQAFQAGSYDQADQHFSRALAADAGDLRCRFARGCARLRQGLAAAGDARTDLMVAAASDFGVVANNEKDSPQDDSRRRRLLAWECAAYCYSSRNAEWLAAIKEADLAFGAGDRSTALLNNRACGRIQLGNLDEAEHDLADVDPQDRMLPAVCCNRAALALRRYPKVRLSAEALADMRVALQAGGDWRLFKTASDLLYVAAEEVGRGRGTMGAASGPWSAWTMSPDWAVLLTRTAYREEALGYLRTAIEQGMPEGSLGEDAFYVSRHGPDVLKALAEIPRPPAAPPARADYRLIDPVGDVLPD
jgi:serine/threonine protein kinase